MTSCDEDEDNRMNSVTSVDGARDNPIHNTFTVGSFFFSFSSILICVPQPPQEKPRGHHEGALEAVGQSPAYSSDIADVWIGGIGDRGIATRSYRSHLSRDFLMECAVSRIYLCYVTCRLKVYRLYQQRLFRETLVVSHLGHQDIVPSIGTFSTSKHPMALVFDYSDNCNLGQSLSLTKAFELLRSNDPHADFFAVYRKITKLGSRSFSTLSCVLFLFWHQHVAQGSLCQARQPSSRDQIHRAFRTLGTLNYAKKYDEDLDTSLIFVSDSIRTLSFKADSGGAQEGLLSAVISDFITDVQSELEPAPNGATTAYLYGPRERESGFGYSARLGLVRLHRVLSVIHDLITPWLAN